MASKIKILDPVQGLIDYTNDIKPYHTKVIEALIEYVGQETVNVSVFEDFNFTIESIYEFDGNFICLLGGYGTPYFGDPETIVISSPDVSKTILEFPAIGTAFFVVLGDRTTLFDPIVDVTLSITGSIQDKIVSVAASAGSPPTNSFTVVGDKTADYPVGSPFTFDVVGSSSNDGTYTVASTTYPIGSPPVLATQIEVNETIPTNSVEGFTNIPHPDTTGIFTVIDSKYTDNFIIPYTTVFITGLSLTPPSFTTTTDRRYVSVVSMQPITYDRILSYSNALRMYETSSPPLPYYVADEGVVVATIVNLSTSPASFSILGDFQSSNLFVGDEFIVESSSGNDGTYNITSMSYDYMGSPISDFVTTFGVTSIPDTNIDGNIKLNIPSNVFILDGSDYTKFFVQGSRVNTTSGSHIGKYTTLNSKFINDKTYIRVRETLIDEGTGTPILSTGTDSIVVDGLQFAGSPPLVAFNIVNSLKNNGAYTVSSITDNGSVTTIQMPSSEGFDPTDITGEIHRFDSGDISYLPEGYGATVDLCELVPQALSISSIEEDFKVLFGHKFVIESTENATNEIVIQDDNNYVYNIFTTGSPPALAGSPPTIVEIIEGGQNNGTYSVIGITGGGSPPSATKTTLTVGGTLQDSGAIGSPPINSGFLLYKNWWQYYVVDIPGGSPNYTFVVIGDATSNISGSPITSIKHIFTGDVYTVSTVIFDANSNTTTITVNEEIETTKPLTKKSWEIVGSPASEPVLVDVPVGSPPIILDVTAGSPPFDDWIISV